MNDAELKTQTANNEWLAAYAQQAATKNPLIRAISGLIDAHHSVNTHQASRAIIDAAEQNLANELGNWQRR